MLTLKLFLRLKKSNFILKFRVKKDDKKIADPEKIIAMRVVEKYRQIFDFLDYKPVDDLLTAEELAEAYNDYSKLVNLF